MIKTKEKDNRKQSTFYLGFVIFFLIIIYAVPAVQAVAEYKKTRHIQALDILIDAFVTPARRAGRLHDLALKQALYSDSLARATGALHEGGADGSTIPRLIDEALAACSEMKKTALTVNRHLSLDSTTPDVEAFDSIRSLLNAVQTPAPSPGVDTSLLAALQRSTSRMARRYPKLSLLNTPLESVKTFKYIFWNDRYLRPYEKEMENASVFAIALRPQVQYARYVLFKDLGEKEIVGKNHWLFYKPDVDYLVKPPVLDPRSIAVDPNDKPMSDNPVKAIQRFKEQLARKGIDLLVVIVPGKPSIYPDLLTGKISSEQAGAFSHSIEMIRELRKHGIETIDLFGPFGAERLRDKSAGDSLYLQRDTHWKARAVRCAARVLADRIKRYPWYRAGTTEYSIDSVVVERTGDIGVMAGLPAPKTPDTIGIFAPEKTKCYRVYRVERDALGAEIRRVLYKDDFRSSQVLLIGDSFSRIYQTDEPRGAGWISHIAFELQQPIASIVNDGGASTLVRQSLARRQGLLKGKKIVVWEIVERDFRYGEEGWKDVPLTLKDDNK